jgi:hypothetical protein
VFVKILRKTYPSLKTLQYSSTGWKAEIHLFVALLQCVANHRRTLKNVKIFHNTVYCLPHHLEQEGTKFFSGKKYQELQSQLKEVQLEELMIDLMKCGPNTGGRWKQLGKIVVG